MLVRARIAYENVTHAAMMIPCGKEFNPNCETDLTSANLNLRLARSRSGAVLTKIVRRFLFARIRYGMPIAQLIGVWG